MSRRIAYICSRYPVLREAFIMREVRALSRAGVEVHAYSLKTPDGRLLKEEQREGAASVYYAPHLFSWRLIGDNLAAFLGSPVKYLSFPAGKAWEVRRYPRQALKYLLLFPKMVHYARHMKRQGIRGANSCWASLPTMVAMVAQRFCAIPYSMTCRAWDIFVPMNQIGLGEKIAGASVVRANNDAGAEFVKRFCRSPEDEAKIQRVYNPFDVEAIRPRKDAPEGRFRITSGGSLVEQKGLTYLLDALSILHQKDLTCDVTLVGEGPLRRSLEKQAAQLGLADSVEFAGAMPNADFLERMKGSGAFVLPSVPAANGCMDGIPNVLIESMSLGVPVVSTNISGIPELIEDGISGLLVPPGDPAALAAAIERLMLDRELQRVFGRNGRCRVESMFEMARNAQSLLTVYEAAGVL